MHKDTLNLLNSSMVEWRHALHAQPELGFHEAATAERVATLLDSFGIEVDRGLASTGVVGTLRVGTSGASIGLRAELDALPINEATGLPYASKTPGQMHACGHDGHLAMLLGAAACLAKTRQFDGTVRFIFQPAEENLAGGRVMVDEGLFERFPVDRVFSMHNLPNMPIGHFAVQHGPAMASADMWTLELKGRGGHAAHPHLARDPVLVAGELIVSIQSIVARSLPPLESGVLSVTMVHGGDALNVIPGVVTLGGTCRAHKPEVRQRIEDRLRVIIAGICAAHEVEYFLDFRSPYPPTVNDLDCAARATRAAIAVAGAERVRLDLPAVMGAEDFAWMLQARPGCLVRIGNGAEGAHAMPLHTPQYDFNDDALAHGAAFWCTLVEQELTLTAASKGS